jgi:hypothetical protein
VFLLSKVPTTITTNPTPNAWAKRREPMTTNYTNNNYPPLPTKKACVDSDNTLDTIESSEQSDTVIVDLEAELRKEHAHTEAALNKECAHMEERLLGLHRATVEEIKKTKKEFNKQIQISIKQSKEQMTSMIQHHIIDIMKSLDMAIS